MLRLSLGRVLVGVNVGLVLLSSVLVAMAAAARMERLTDEQALARVQFAGAGAQKDISRAGESLQISARLLGERPTLARLLREEEADALARFLDQFRNTSRLSGCAVITRAGVFARSGAPLPWEGMAADPAAEGRFCLRSLPGGTLALVASSPVPTLPGSKVLTALLLDREFERGVSERTGLPVKVLEREAALAREGDPEIDLRSSALADDRPVQARLDAAGLYLAIHPLRDCGGRPVGIVEAETGRKATAASLRDFEQSLAVLAAVVTAAALLLSLLVARWLTRPLESLTRSSARIGAGDLATPIPRAGGLEVGALAETMEEMRRRLSHLTAELGRRRSEAEAVLGGILEGVFAVDRERRIRYINPQTAALLGVPAGEALGRFCGDVLNPRGPGGVRPCDESCPIVHARSGGSARATETLWLPGGRRRTVLITSASAGGGGPAAAGEDPDVLRQFQVIRDETDIEAARRLRDAILANISHEFKTPLAAQLASIELLRDRLPDLNAPEAQQLVLSLERGTLRLTHLIDNLLESVRIEAGGDSPRRRRVALDEVVEEAVEMMAPLIAQKQQALSVDLPYPMPPILGDAPRLSQVFVNLLANANKFAPAGSSIRIGGLAGAREVTLWVEDEGPGLPPGVGASLFERFVRAGRPDEDEEPEPTGMGLGLWIVRSIVERHGGRVEIRRAAGEGTGAEGSPAAGAGERRGRTRVCVTLPAGDENENPDR
jgi:signal transduction histidine kinase